MPHPSPSLLINVLGTIFMSFSSQSAQHSKSQDTSGHLHLFLLYKIADYPLDSSRSMHPMTGPFYSHYQSNQIFHYKFYGKYKIFSGKWQFYTIFPLEKPVGKSEVRKRTFSLFTYAMGNFPIVYRYTSSTKFSHEA